MPLQFTDLMIGRYFRLPKLGLLVTLPAILVVLADLDADGAEVPCSTGGDAAGWSVATGFDVSGDGVADVAVGEPCARLEGLRSAGRVTVFSGSDGTVLRRIRGTQEDQKLGGAIAFSDDLSGDGRADLIVGSPGWDAPRPGGGVRAGAGKVEVYSSLEGTVIVLAEGFYAGGGLGEAVAALGDTDGDQVPDFAAGAGNDRDAPAGEKVGVVYRFSGSDGQILDSNLGERRFDEWGRVMGTAQDVDGDGVDDLMVASNLADVPAGGGALSASAELGMGGNQLTPTTTLTTTTTLLLENAGLLRVLSGADLATTLFEAVGQVAEEKLGRSVALVADADGDGNSDVLTGVPGLDVGVLGEAGAVRLYSTASGATLMTANEPIPQAGAGFGTALATVGRIDEDGRDDFVSAAPTAQVGQILSAGRLHALSGIDGSLLWTLSGGLPGMRLGQSLAAGPDWNGDGTPDAVVGAPGDAPLGRRGAGTVRIVSGADGAELRRFAGRRGFETRVFALGHGIGGSVQLQSYAASGRRRGLADDLSRLLRDGALSIAVMDDVTDPEPDQMKLVLGAGAGADAPTVFVVSATRRRRVASAFPADFGAPYSAGVNVAAGDLEAAQGDDIAAVQGDSTTGNVEVALYRRFDVDPLGRISWLSFDRFSVFEADTQIQGIDVDADGATIAVGDVLSGGRDELVVGPVAGAPVVRVFSSTGGLRAEWPAYPPGTNSGTSVALGDLDGDGSLEIVTGPMTGQPRIKAFRGTGSPFVPPGATSPIDFFAPSPAFSGGVRVAVADVDLDGQGEILVVQGAGATPNILAYEMNGSAVAGWSAPQPFGPTSSGAFAIATTDRFLRQP